MWGGKWVVLFASVPFDFNSGFLKLKEGCFCCLYDGAHNMSRLFDILPIFFSPQVKRMLIFSDKNGVYELQNDFRRRRS